MTDKQIITKSQMIMRIAELSSNLEVKEQECKILREEKAYTDMACEQFEKQLNAKEQECKELNNTITNLENTKEELLTKIENQKEENIIFTLETRKLVAQYSAKLKQLKQTLTEIKEIAEEYEELHGFLDCSGDLILQKISEVEDER